MVCKVTITGESINMEKEVDEESAYSIMGILMGVKQAEGTPAGTFAGQTGSSNASGYDPELTIGEFLEELGVQTNPERVAAIAMYLRDYRGQESVPQTELSSLFQQAGEVPPKNISRDVNNAVRNRLIAEDAENPDCYRVTKTGEKSIAQSEK